jgi:chemosensory pili system protein ChpB (putative protein-glutamate methylesterase)
MKPVDVDAATRVALLARPGVARERLEAALAEAGADVVLVADPSQSDAAGVRATGAEAILIALDPQVDEALDRYDALLADPAITVIFDEAELAAQREGWDAARWTRHLAAKLNRHEHVLPPGAGMDVDAVVLPDPSQADVHAGLDDGLPSWDDSDGGASIDALAFSVGADEPALSDDNDAVADSDLDAFLDAISIGGPDASEPTADDMTAGADMSAFLDAIDLGTGLSIPDAAAPVEENNFMSFDPTLAEFDMAADTGGTTLAPLDFDRPGNDEPAERTIQPDADAAPERSDNQATKDRFRLDLDALELRIADMQLEDVHPTRAPSTDGAILVMAGIGGPDAVRQLLAGLPAAFPRAVLIQQRLEGARHDNLVRQMQRATAMPVSLAESGGALQRGHVYVLPTGMGVAAQPDGLHFEGGVDELIARLPPADSAVVLLSGADPAQVDATLALGLRGSLVAGQSPDGCFDAVASEALVARGGTSAAPADIAKQLATRWPS